MKMYIFKKQKKKNEGKDNQDFCQGKNPTQKKGGGFRNSQNTVISKESTGEQSKISRQSPMASTTFGSLMFIQSTKAQI